MTTLDCYVYPSWNPNLHAAPQERDWMDATQHQYAYRCLPLNIANCHGWEMHTTVDVDVYWRGGDGIEDIRIESSEPGNRGLPVSIFGHGILTFHIDGIFRTDPGMNLFITAPLNRPKEGIYGLTAIVETDWAPMTFTYNYKLLRRNHKVTFNKDEPFCTIFPVSRRALQECEPRIVPIEQNPDLAKQYKTWETSRNAFHEKQRTCPIQHQTDTWQKDYFMGRDMDGARQKDHVVKLRLPEFSPLDK